MAFGSLPPLSKDGNYTVISLGHVHEFLQAYMREHWDIVHHAQFKEGRRELGIILVCCGMHHT